MSAEGERVCFVSLQSMGRPSIPLTCAFLMNFTVYQGNMSKSCVFSDGAHGYPCVGLFLSICTDCRFFLFNHFIIITNWLMLFQESLKYRLLGSDGDIGSWGHEYVR